MRVRPAFSAIEMLTIVGVVSVLVAVLFPLLAQRRAQAQRSACLANLRQIGFGLRLFSQDYSDAFPEAISTAEGVLKTAGLPWHRAIMPYMANARSGAAFTTDRRLADYRGAGLYHVCPEAQVPVTDPWHSTYSVHHVFFKPAGRTYPFVGVGRFSMIPRPAEVGIVLDGSQDLTAGWAWDHFWNTYNGPFQHPPDLRAPCDVDNPDEDGAPGYARYRHDGACHLLFADGHVASRRRGTLRYADFTCPP